VTSTNNLLDSLVNGAITLVSPYWALSVLRRIDSSPSQQAPLPTSPPELYDNAPVNYYGVVAWHGYRGSAGGTNYPGFKMAQNGFRIGVPVSSPSSIPAWTSTIPSSLPC